MTIRFNVNEALTHRGVGRLDPATWSFGDPLTSVGEASLSVTIPDVLAPNSMLQRIVPNEYELVITDGEFNRGAPIMWAGWIDLRVPKPAKVTVDFHATHWKGWLYKRLIPPGTFGTIKGDEYDIVYALIDWATSAPGAPRISRGLVKSGQNRQLTVGAWWSVGQAIDNLAKRDGAFEWSIGFRTDAMTGLLEPFLELWEQGAPRGRDLLLMLDNTRATNRVSVGDMAEDGSIEATRVYTSSDGEDPVFVKDDDPRLTSGRMLLETRTTYQNNRDRTLLSEYARAERSARSNPYSTVPVSTGIDTPAVSSYRTGDRARLRVRDAWRDVDHHGVRIVDKSVTKSPGKPAVATLLLDLADIRNIAPVAQGVS